MGRNFRGGDGGEKTAAMRRAAGEGEMAERGPDFAPGDFAVFAVLERRGAHRRGGDILEAADVARRQDGVDPGFESGQFALHVGCGLGLGDVLAAVGEFASGSTTLLDKLNQLGNNFVEG